jgi:hypothetical protein
LGILANHSHAASWTLWDEGVRVRFGLARVNPLFHVFFVGAETVLFFFASVGNIYISFASLSAHFVDVRNILGERLAVREADSVLGFSMPLAKDQNLLVSKAESS